MPMPRAVLVLAGLILCAARAPADPAPTAAARAPGAPISGVVKSVEGSRVTVAQQDGSLRSFLLTPATVLTIQKKATFADIKPHDFVASAGILGADGRTQAQEVRIFPESMRGAGEGHTPMALPNQTMTNATVTKVAASMTNATVSAIGAGVLTTVYPGGSTEIVVDPGTPVWSIVTVDRSRLVPGTALLAFVTRDADGNLAARYVGLK